jgi:hypothetical protein
VGPRQRVILALRQGAQCTGNQGAGGDREVRTTNAVEKKSVLALHYQGKKLKRKATDIVKEPTPEVSSAEVVAVTGRSEPRTL